MVQLTCSRLHRLADYAERRIRKRIAELPDGLYVAEDALDNDGVTLDPVPTKSPSSFQEIPSPLILQEVQEYCRQHQRGCSDDHSATFYATGLHES